MIKFSLIATVKNRVVQPVKFMQITVIKNKLNYYLFRVFVIILHARAFNMQS